MARPWFDWPILEKGEIVRKLPDFLHRFEPHPYVSLGAPYETGEDPYMLRDGVIQRLTFAQDLLQKENPQLCLSVFDGLRPISVQKYMFDYSVDQECKSRNLNLSEKNQTEQINKVIKLVETFWALPSFDPLNPPPHSTGGAVDLTISTKLGVPLDLGGEIDLVSPISEPNFYLDESKSNPGSQSSIWHMRRCLLQKVMIDSGFVQHPKEWWHFSYGDQMWAWKTKAKYAIYGVYSPAFNND